jgi:hypothetical protein
MKLVASYALWAAAMTGLLPKNSVASIFRLLDSVKSLNMGKPHPKFAEFANWCGGRR